MIQFYKPNPKVTGSACSFWSSTEEKAFFSSFIKQDSWNADRRVGSFVKNKDNPRAKVMIKFSMVEASGIVDAIERNAEYGGYHGSKNQIVKFKFAPYVSKKENKQVGYSFSVNKEDKEDSTNKISFVIGLYYPEARMLKQFLIYSLERIFEKTAYTGKNKKEGSYKENDKAETADKAPKPEQEKADPLDDQEW